MKKKILGLVLCAVGGGIAGSYLPKSPLPIIAVLLGVLLGEWGMYLVISE